MSSIYKSNAKIKAKPMTRLEYNNLRNWDLPSNEDGSDDGFCCVNIDDNHMNWFPKKQFERQFSKVYDE